MLLRILEHQRAFLAAADGDLALRPAAARDHVGAAADLLQDLDRKGHGRAQALRRSPGRWCHSPFSMAQNWSAAGQLLAQHQAAAEDLRFLGEPGRIRRGQRLGEPAQARFALEFGPERDPQRALAARARRHGLLAFPRASPPGRRGNAGCASCASKVSISASGESAHAHHRLDFGVPVVRAHQGRHRVDALRRQRARHGEREVAADRIHAGHDQPGPALQADDAGREHEAPGRRRKKCVAPRRAQARAAAGEHGVQPRVPGLDERRPAGAASRNPRCAGSLPYQPVSKDSLMSFLPAPVSGARPGLWPRLADGASPARPPPARRAGGRAAQRCPRQEAARRAARRPPPAWRRFPARIQALVGRQASRRPSCLGERSPAGSRPPAPARGAETARRERIAVGAQGLRADFPGLRQAGVRHGHAPACRSR